MSSRRPVDSFAASMMLVLCAIWGTQQVAIKLVAEEMSPLLQVGIRSGIAAAIVAIVAMMRNELGWFRAGTWKPGLVVGALFGIEFVFVGVGLRHTSASHMAIFLYTAPIFAALGLHVGMREERLSAVQWGGILVAFAGVVVSFAFRGGAGAGDFALFGDLLGVMAGAAWGATTVVIRGSRLSDAPASVTLLYQLMGAFLLACGGAVVLGQAEVVLSPALVLSVGYQSLVVAVVSYLAWFALLRTYLASRLGVLSFMTPLFGVTSGVLVLGEPLDGAFLAGSLLVVAGILLVSGAGARNSKFGIRNSVERWKGVGTQRARGWAEVREGGNSCES
ncbi:DMT family transporter [Lacunimicrobium album]